MVTDLLCFKHTLTERFFLEKKGTTYSQTFSCTRHSGPLFGRLQT
jgi:hypothetical protein